MRIGYTSPASVVASSQTFSGSWLTADGAAACYDGKPSRKARMQWRSDAVPAVDHFVGVDLVFTAPTRIGVVALLGLANVPVGTKLIINARRETDPANNYDLGRGTNQATVIEFADGTRGCWIVAPLDNTPVVRVGFRIYNDVAGATWANAATTIDIGELVAMPAVEIEHESSWDMPLVDPSSGGRSRGSQSYVSRRTPYRRLQAAFPPEYVNKVRGGGLANGMDWTKLAYAVAGQRRMAAIVRTLSQAETNATAIYGTAALSGERHAGGDYYSAGIVVEEEPAT